jgi:tRNA pseudouridine38-40 synthase
VPLKRHRSAPARPRGPSAGRSRPSYRLDLEYDGTRYGGWQVQQNARSVAGELTRAVASAGAELVELTGSGRTDAGVHALGQVAHLRLAHEIDPLRLELSLNREIPADIHVRSVRVAAAAFHARHDARRRSYLYQISRRRTAFAKRFVWWVREALDVEAMAAAAAALVGRHDFRAFCEQPAAQSSTIVVVDDVRVVEAGELILVRLSASHFLWKMVRRVVGALVRVGSGELPVDGLARLLDDPARGAGARIAEWTAPPSGLFLERVEYPGEPPVGEVQPAFDLGSRPLPRPIWIGASRSISSR